MKDTEPQIQETPMNIKQAKEKEVHTGYIIVKTAGHVKKKNRKILFNTFKEATIKPLIDFLNRSSGSQQRNYKFTFGHVEVES